MHTEVLSLMDLDFPSVVSENCCLAGSRLIELEVSNRKAYSYLEGKTSRKGLELWQPK